MIFKQTKMISLYLELSKLKKRAVELDCDLGRCLATYKQISNAFLLIFFLIMDASDDATRVL